MSDEEDFEDSDEGDFSVSEDDWKPNENDATDSSSMSDFEDTASSPNEALAKARGTSKGVKKNSQSTARPSKRLPMSLRMKLYNKYKPPPKIIKRSSDAQAPSTSNIAGSSHTSAKAIQDSDSSSSDEEHFVNPNELDLNSEFFGNTGSVDQDEAPNFDCNAGICSNDSSDEDDENDKTSQVKARNASDLNRFHEFNENLVRAKSQLTKTKFTPTDINKVPATSDITTLLSMGETGTFPPSKPIKSKNRKKRQEKDDNDSDDLDWEEVEEMTDAGLASNQIQNVEITLGNDVGSRNTKMKSAQNDLEACLKRKINRQKRETQAFMHKVHVMSWVGHGNHLNRILNNLSLMNMSLKLLPSKDSYPNGVTSQKYFESLVKWFKTKVQLKSPNAYPPFSQLPPLPTSIGLQIRGSHAICYRDLVFIFVILLRAMGTQCRVVMNFQTIAKKPPQSELFTLSSKETDISDKISKGKNGDEKKQLSVGKTKQTVKQQSGNKATITSPEKRPVTINKVSSSNTSGKTLSEKLAPGSSKLETLREQKCVVEIQTKKMPTNVPPSNIAKTKRIVPESSSAHHSPKQKKRISGKIDSPHFSKREANIGNEHSTTNKTAALKRESAISDIDAGVSHPKSAKRNVSEEPLMKANSRAQHVTKGVRNTGSYKTSDAAKADTSAVSAAKQTNTVFSPRKTRSRTVLQTQEASGQASIRTASSSSSSRTKRNPPKSIIPQLDGATDVNKKSSSSTSTRNATRRRRHNSDSDFEPSEKKNKRTPEVQKPKNKAKSSLLDRIKRIDRRVLSTDDEGNEVLDNSVRTEATNYWPELYCEKEQKWIAVDLLKAKVDAVQSIMRSASKPVIYVYAWNNNNGIRDVTPRYNSQMLAVRKARIDVDWLEDLLHPFVEPRNPINMIEDMEFNKITMDQPLPSTISEYKNHPLYALERHLLKFQAIYPADAPTLGFIRGEPVYARECVITLHSREIWVKQARVVKPGETPYKIVKSRPKWDRAMNKMLEPQPLEIFGLHQTTAYVPPTAMNGVVPRNPYGNVELFKPEMLPIGTRHLQLPGLQKTCKKMNVDCAQAVIGFDFHSGASHPTFDGFVVCEEFADAVVEQWWTDQQEAERKEMEKVQARVWGNWKKLIKGLFIRERLKRKFNFSGEPSGKK